ncbi:MAG: 4-(cytidine 5'-diphospho)-2-C-methyl-D-erythritol kinase [Chloroflexi bacterium]|nr:4-(cytidine 5'-diphospho)-2-C-methyl-D-erythritol kinase [Chloroflexota bacterium]MBI2980235.1 4-(cytidine 5'-diphospho)-2-C-methyl-D-erythritol kinase [Chloroflexota bacterium]
MLTLLAPAKLNLTLEVLGKRHDGFHEVRSIMQTIDLADSLSFQSSEQIEFKSNSPGWIAMKSLVFKATFLLRQVAGSFRGVSVGIKKVVPLLSGLGGDSSDAAAVLRGLNQLWGLGLSTEELLVLAEQLGSDVAFFLYGGTALVEGRGEMVTALPSLAQHWIVLTIPPSPRLPGKTKQLYDSLKDAHYTDGQASQRLAEILKTGKEITPSLLFNTFENVAFTHFSELGALREDMVEAGATDIHLAGSGPALFTLLADRTQAEELYTRLQQAKVECYLTKTLPAVDRASE